MLTGLDFTLWKMQKNLEYVPQRVCIAQVKQMISVRRRSVPLKQSKYDVPSEKALSSAFVCSIIAIVSSALKFGSCSGDVSLCRARLAPSRSPRLMSHQGDSGARETPTMSGNGQIHCNVNGIRNPHSSFRMIIPL